MKGSVLVGAEFVMGSNSLEDLLLYWNSCKHGLLPLTYQITVPLKLGSTTAHFSGTRSWTWHHSLIVFLSVYPLCPWRLVSSIVKFFSFSMSKRTSKKTPVDPDFTLRRVFGKANFRYLLCLFFPKLFTVLWQNIRPYQREIITAALDGHDVFVQAGEQSSSRPR